MLAIADRSRSAGYACAALLLGIVVPLGDTARAQSTVEPNVHGYTHVAIGVRDLDRALVFYRDVLGLRVTTRIVKSAHRESVYLRWDDASPPEPFVVLDTRGKDPPAGSPAKLLELGFHHIGFAVRNLDEILARARAHGMAISPEVISDGYAFGYCEKPSGVPMVRTVTMQDPDGNIVQLDQPLDPDSDRARFCKP